jgi:invasion protein IalB
LPVARSAFDGRLYRFPDLGYHRPAGRVRVTLLPYLLPTHAHWGARSSQPIRCENGQEEDQSMTFWNVSAPARPVARALATTVAAALIAVLAGSTLAQTPKPAPKPQAKPPAPTQPAPPPQQAQPEVPQLIFSPWTKFCLKGKEANAKQVCFTGKDGRVESGMPVVAAVLIEPEGEPKKVLRVTLPLGMSLQPGTRVIVDQGQPMTGPYVICFTNGCMADYEASNELIQKLKSGQGLVVQGINGAGQPISLVLPLQDFAKAYDGPPTDPKVFEEQQKKLQDELQKRAEEARKKLEQQK